MSQDQPPNAEEKPSEEATPAMPAEDKVFSSAEDKVPEDEAAQEQGEEAMQLSSDASAIRKLGFTILMSRTFERLMGAVIGFNFVVVIVEIDNNAKEVESAEWVWYASWGLLGTFVSELTAKLLVFRSQFWHDKWNCFDFVVIAIDSLFSLLEVLWLSFLSLSMLRILQLSRLPRAQSSFKAIFWGSMVLLFVCMIHPQNEGKVEKLWDKTTALRQMPLPSPEQIEKLVCEVASQKQIEEKATAEICNLISDKVVIPDCQDTLQKLWDEATAICQVPGPIPEQIERLVCEVATKEEFKEKVDQAAAEICTLITQQGVTIPGCLGDIKNLWDTIVAQCPKGHEMSSSSPDEIWKLLCEVATKKEFKQKVDEAAAQLCTLLAKNGATVPDCQNVFEEMWDKLIVAECPKGRAMTLPSPDEIEKPFFGNAPFRIWPILAGLGGFLIEKALR